MPFTDSSIGLPGDPFRVIEIHFTEADLDDHGVLHDLVGERGEDPVQVVDRLEHVLLRARVHRGGRARGAHEQRDQVSNPSYRRFAVRVTSTTFMPGERRLHRDLTGEAQVIDELRVARRVEAQHLDAVEHTACDRGAPRRRLLQADDPLESLPPGHCHSSFAPAGAGSLAA
jgi:hypothetical protein